MTNSSQLLARGRARMSGLVGKPISADNLEKLADIIADIENQAMNNRISLDSDWAFKTAKSLGLKSMYERMYG